MNNSETRMINNNRNKYLIKSIDSLFDNSNTKKIPLVTDLSNNFRCMTLHKPLALLALTFYEVVSDIV